MNALLHILSHVRKNGVRRHQMVSSSFLGRVRVFEAWDVGDDTFIFEKGIRKALMSRPSVLVVEKSALARRGAGYILTVTTGNHSVAALPLLDGRFWRLSHLPAARRSETLFHKILCANLVDGALEISQRDVPSKLLFKADAWLLETVRLSYEDVVMLERNELTLDYFRSRGQEWRVKPLAWTETEMRVALAASKRRIASKITYYHSARGVHFLSFAAFSALAELARTNPDEFVKGLRELVSVYEGNTVSFTRMIKYRGHHEIEFFGMRRGVALERLIPELEKLMEAIVLNRIGQLGVIQRISEIVVLYHSLLTKPALADETTREFTETLYMYITGEVYAVAGEGSTPAFDDRRTALPGATFVEGRPVFHPGADSRTEVLLSNLRALVSQDERVEYANVYELREGPDVAFGRGRTREVVYKTNRGPLEHSLLEKRLSHSMKGYGSYVLARVEALRALGISLADYRILRRRAQASHRSIDFFTRSRCEGEPMDSIPANYFRSFDDASGEDREAVLGLASLLGDAAAQNLAMKKFDSATQSPLYGIGKEIFAFEYDLLAQRVVPKAVSTCSIRGCFGWPDLSLTEENLLRIGNFYMAHYAHALKAYQKRHTVPMAEIAERFFSGFEYRTHSLSWKLSVMRDRFEDFNPSLPARYAFDRKWRFLLWTLERQERRLPILRKMFFQKVEIVENEDNRNHPESLRVESLPGQAAGEAGWQTACSVGG